MIKVRRMNEIAWVLGVILCSLGVSLCTKAGFGLSMIAAPAYIIHIKMETILTWYTQGVSEYIFQGVLLIVMCLAVRKIKFRYLLSFLTAFISGLFIDGWLWILGGNAVYDTTMVRIIAFIIGELITTLAVAFYFRTSMPLQIYELFVKEVAVKYGFPIDRVKHTYDICALVLSIALAYILNNSFQGIGIGTLIITLVNAPLIKMFGILIDKVF